MKEDNINKMFRDEFTDFKVKPADSVWVGLSKKLWWIKFWKFSFRTVNIYSAILLLLLFGGSLYAIFNLTDHDTSSFTTKEITKSNQDSQSESIKSKNNQTDSKSEIEVNEKPSGLLSSNTGNSEELIKNDATGFENEEDVITETSERPAPSQSDEPYVAGKTENSEIISDKIDDVNVKDEKEPGQTITETPEKITEIESLAIANEKTDVKQSDQSEPDKAITSDGKEPLKSEQSESEIETDITSDIFEQIETAIVYDTIRIFDTIPVYDTISVIKSPKVEEKKTKKKSSSWSLNVYSGLNNSAFKYSSDKAKIKEASNFATSPGYGFTLGTKLGYQINRIELEAGIEYNQINESFSFSAGNSESLGEFWVYNPGGTLTIHDTIDTKFVWDPIEQIYIEIPVLRDSVVQLYDSTLIKNLQTEYTNKYSYLNIPLMFGYDLYKSTDMRITAKVGGTIGLRMNAKGKSLTVNNSNDLWFTNLDDSSIPFINMNFNWQLGIGFTYRLNKHYRFTLDPYYRRSTSSLYEKDYILGSELALFGINAGIKYKF
jgi:hypothetical protein